MPDFLVLLRTTENRDGDPPSPSIGLGIGTAGTHTPLHKKGGERDGTGSFPFLFGWHGYKNPYDRASAKGGGGAWLFRRGGVQCCVTFQFTISYYSFKFCSFSVCCYVTTFVLKYTRQPCTVNKCVARPLPPRPNYRT